MSEWWTYRLSDLLLFAPETYWRLFELYNAAVWPAHVLAWGGGATLLWLVRTPGAVRSPAPHDTQVAQRQAGSSPHRARAALALLALAWLWTGLVFHARHYSTINWAAEWLAWIFATQGFVLACVAALGLRPRLTQGWRRRSGLLLLWASLAYPAFGALRGHPWQQAEVVGLAPDPTALTTLGLLLCLAPAARPSPPLVARLAAGASAWTIPLAWCLASGATLWTMGTSGAWLLPVVAALTSAALVRKALRPPG